MTENVFLKVELNIKRKFDRALSDYCFCSLICKEK